MKNKNKLVTSNHEIKHTAGADSHGNDIKLVEVSPTGRILVCLINNDIFIQII